MPLSTGERNWEWITSAQRAELLWTESGHVNKTVP